VIFLRQNNENLILSWRVKRGDAVPVVAAAPVVAAPAYYYPYYAPVFSIDKLRIGKLIRCGLQLRLHSNLDIRNSKDRLSSLDRSILKSRAILGRTLS